MIIDVHQFPSTTPFVGSFAERQQITKLLMDPPARAEHSFMSLCHRKDANSLAGRNYFQFE